jgi:GNAT superfamily N-acetyltransferase
VSAGLRVGRVDAPSLARLRPALCELLVDSVEHGASVGFVSPLSHAEAEDYWRRIERAVAADRCVLFAAALDDRRGLGTVQLDVDTLPNQRHRATVAKVLVHTSARRRGVGEALMRALEEEAQTRGRWLLTLDTATGDAARLYERLGWTASGTIPDYALNPDGSLTDTTFYWKRVG